MKPPHTKASTQNVGKAAEVRAAEFLQQQGLKIETCNYHNKTGEIDIIARHHQTLVFVEVRARKHSNFGLAFETVNHSKQRKIIRTALLYLQEKQLVEKIACRFDIVALHHNAEPQWIQDAFQP